MPSYYETYYDAETEDEYRRPSRRTRPHSQESVHNSRHDLAAISHLSGSWVQ